jgi:hypothetical protein
MEAKSPKVETRPPELMDRAMHLLFPPAAREAVLGDLWERYRSPLQYAGEAARVLPHLIVSQIRRNSNAPMLGIAAFSLLVGFGGIVGPNAPPIDVPRWLRAAIPLIAALAGLILRDAYRDSARPSARRAAFDVVTVALCVLFCEAVLAALIAGAGLSPDWILTFPLRRALLTAFALATVFALRMAADYRLPCAEGELSPDDLAREFHQFERGVRWRKRREVISAIGGLVVGVGFLWRVTGLAMQIGWALSIAVALLLILYLAANTNVAPMPGEMGFASSLAFYRGQLERQRKLLRRVAWYWLLPMLPPLVGQMIEQEITGAPPLLTPLQVGAYLVICFLVGWLYEQSARKLQRRGASLAAIAPLR